MGETHERLGDQHKSQEYYRKTARSLAQSGDRVRGAVREEEAGQRRSVKSSVLSLGIAQQAKVGVGVFPGGEEILE